MDVALREGDLDARLAEGLVDGRVQLISDGDEAVDVWDEHAEFEVQGAVAETEEQGSGIRIIQNAGSNRTATS
jgi:hypothetical protein